jgi:hypothetical protein
VKGVDGMRVRTLAERGLAERVRIGNPSLEPTPEDISPGYRVTREMLANVPDEEFMRIVREELKRRGGYK